MCVYFFRDFEYQIQNRLKPILQVFYILSSYKFNKPKADLEI